MSVNLSHMENKGNGGAMFSLVNSSLTEPISAINAWSKSEGIKLSLNDARFILEATNKICRDPPDFLLDYVKQLKEERRNA